MAAKLYLATEKNSLEKNTGFGRYLNAISKIPLYDGFIGERLKLKGFVDESKIIDIDIQNYTQSLYSILLSLDEGDIVHFPTNLIPDIVIPDKLRVVLTIHDITPAIIFKKYFFNKSAIKWEANVKRGLMRAECVFTVSENSKKDIVNYFNMSAAKVVVTYSGVESDFKKLPKDIVDDFSVRHNFRSRKVILGPGNMTSHKNVWRLIIAFIKYNHRHDSELVLIGRGRKAKYVIGMLRFLGIDVKVSGLISDEDLVRYYNIAEVFVFPTLYEGFGLPPLEAMACGTPVICSNNSSLAEIAGPGSVMVNPYRVGEIADAIEKIVQSSELKKVLIKKGYENVQAYTWNRTRKITQKVLSDIKYKN